MNIKREDVLRMKVSEIMSLLGEIIKDYKYAKLTYEEFVEIEDVIDICIERLEKEHVLLALPYKLQLGKY